MRTCFLLFFVLISLKSSWASDAAEIEAQLKAELGEKEEPFIKVVVQDVLKEKQATGYSPSHSISTGKRLKYSESKYPLQNMQIMLLVYTSHRTEGKPRIWIENLSHKSSANCQFSPNKSLAIDTDCATGKYCKVAIPVSIDNFGVCDFDAMDFHLFNFVTNFDPSKKGNPKLVWAAFRDFSKVQPKAGAPKKKGR